MEADFSVTYVRLYLTCWLSSPTSLWIIVRSVDEVTTPVLCGAGMQQWYSGSLSDKWPGRNQRVTVGCTYISGGRCHWENPVLCLYPAESRVPTGLFAGEVQDNVRCPSSWWSEFSSGGRSGGVVSMVTCLDAAAAAAASRLASTSASQATRSPRPPPPSHGQ